ncbi:MAG: hypothetical protein KJ792_03005 [Actinobacteria bacterium]|nr:hypothetical protein [Actinomycetota bacterium]MCG2801462.1 hypothetical protein [Cellulomonas sp.]
MSTENTTTDPADLVPPKVRTAAYVLGIVLGVGIAPALLAAGLTVWAGVAAALAGGASAIAYGYRPTRQ